MWCRILNQHSVLKKIIQENTAGESRGGATNVFDAAAAAAAAILLIIHAIDDCSLPHALRDAPTAAEFFF
jgi:hypothetical protein